MSQIVAEGEALPEFDYHCPLLSLPRAFKTDIRTIPSPTPYLRADRTKARDWRDRIGAGDKLKVGVIWSGGFRPNPPQPPKVTICGFSTRYRPSDSTLQNVDRLLRYTLRLVRFHARAQIKPFRLGL